MRRTLSVLVLSIALAACGGSSATVDSEPPPAAPSVAPETRTPGSAQVSGTVEGDPLAMVDAVLVPGKEGARIVLVDRADYCAHPDVEKSDSHVLTLDLGAKGATSIAPGDYQVVEAFDDTSRALAARLDSIAHACASTKQYVGHSGTASITEASATRVAGSFAVTLGHDTVTGTFVATSCLTTPPASTISCVE